MRQIMPKDANTARTFLRRNRVIALFDICGHPLESVGASRHHTT
jgi:hypothetical protein